MNATNIIDEGDCETDSVAITFLIVNRIPELPRIAIASALAVTGVDILIGYLNSADIVDLPVSNRLKFVRLGDFERETSQSRDQEIGYSDFLTSDFYDIVKLKWQLLKNALDLKYNYIVYSDIDVIWNSNPIPALLQSFRASSGVQVLIQSFTTDPHLPNLCMGFVCFRKSKESLEFIESCERSHFEESMNGQLIGDDSIVTMNYMKLGCPSWIRELPQSTFPTGWMLNLYSTTPKFPGLKTPDPYIFHANWVVGLESKRLLTRLFLSGNQRDTYSAKMSAKWRLLLMLKIVQHQIRKFRQSGK